MLSSSFYLNRVSVCSAAQPGTSSVDYAASASWVLWLELGIVFSLLRCPIHRIQMELPQSFPRWRREERLNRGLFQEDKTTSSLAFQYQGQKKLLWLNFAFADEEVEVCQRRSHSWNWNPSSGVLNWYSFCSTLYQVVETAVKYDRPALSLSIKPKDCKHRKWAGMRFRGNNKLCQVWSVQGFPVHAPNCQKSPERGLKKRKTKKTKLRVRV